MSQQSFILSDGSNDAALLNTTPSGTEYGVAVRIIGAAAGGTSSLFTSAFPSSGTAAGFTDGTNMQSARVFDLDSSGGTEYILGTSLRFTSSGGSVEAGTVSNPLRIDPTGTTTQPISGTVTANAGTGTFTVSGTVAATQSGTWTVQPGNTANTTPWLTTISQGGNSATVTGSNALKVDGSAVTQPVSGTITANIGTTNGLALDATLAKLTIAQGASLGSNTQALIGGSITTAAPSYTNGQISPLSLTTSGLLRVDGSGVTQPISGTVTANAGTGTFTISGTVTANQGGTWTVQPGNTQNTTAWLTQDAADGPVTPGAVASKSILIGGQFNTSLPTLTNTQQAALQVDSSGRLLVGSIASALPTGGNTIGAVTQASGPWTQNITQFGGNNIVTGTGASGTGIPRVTVSNDSNILATQSGTWTVQQGGAPWTVTGTKTNNNAAPGATNVGTLPALANTAAPSYTDGYQVALSVDGSGGLRVATHAVTQSGGPWTQNITQFGSSNVVTGTGASGAGIPRITVSNDSNILATQSGTWTVAQGTAAALSGAWPIKLTDGTNTMPTGDAVGRAVFQKITDGTQTAEVTAASAAAAAIDPGLVVALSPNSPTPAGPDTVGTTGALGALNATVSVAVNGQQSSSFDLAAGTLIGTLTPEQSYNGGTTWFPADWQDPTSKIISQSVVFAANNTATTRSILVRGGATNIRVRVSAYTSGTANGNVRAVFAANTTDFTVITDSSGNTLPINADGTTPINTLGIMVDGYDSTNNAVRRLAVDSQGRLITAPAGSVSATSGFAFGDVALSSITTAVIRRTTYTEQTTNAQRSVKSASASDTLAGTGAQKIKITYYDQTGAGPSTETISMNGTAAVNTVSTTMCFIEKIEVTQVGSGGNNAGIITLFTTTGGGGSAIGTIGATDNKTFWAHHYTPTGKTTYITDVSAIINGGAGIFFLKAQTLNSTGAVDVQITDWIRESAQSSTTTRAYATPIQVVGPARIVEWVTTEAGTSLIYRGSFDFYDQ